MKPHSELARLDFPTECRVSFRQPVTRVGFIDGGWWPRSTDLTAELPALLEVLWTAGRDITRISYRADAWTAAPPEMIIEGRRVDLTRDDYQNPLLITASDCARQDIIDLLVVPSQTDPAVADRMLRLASEPGNANSPARVLEMARS
jgi:hypothetical protein